MLAVPALQEGVLLALCHSFIKTQNLRFKVDFRQVNISRANSPCVKLQRCYDRSAAASLFNYQTINPVLDVVKIHTPLFVMADKY